MSETLGGGSRIEVLNEGLENVGRFGDIDAGDLGGCIGGLGQAEHALENRGREAEDEPVNTEFFPV